MEKQPNDDLIQRYNPRDKSNPGDSVVRGSMMGKCTLAAPASTKRQNEKPPWGKGGFVGSTLGGRVAPFGPLFGGKGGSVKSSSSA
jgi:hypothetical protein